MKIRGKTTCARVLRKTQRPICRASADSKSSSKAASCSRRRSSCDKWRSCDGNDLVPISQWCIHFSNGSLFSIRIRPSSANPNQNHYGMSCGTTRSLPFGGKGSLSGQDHMSQTFKVRRLAESGHIWTNSLVGGFNSPKKDSVGAIRAIIQSRYWRNQNQQKSYRINISWCTK